MSTLSRSANVEGKRRVVIRNWRFHSNQSHMMEGPFGVGINRMEILPHPPCNLERQVSTHIFTFVIAVDSSQWSSAFRGVHVRIRVALSQSANVVGHQDQPGQPDICHSN